MIFGGIILILIGLFGTTVRIIECGHIDILCLLASFSLICSGIELIIAKNKIKQIEKD